ncbi:hypothetical protein RJ639_038853 [Escallonia herrerae]|uniref:Uncharacterized protein n=1 Tax=Escallonia herrerae TaxID=1293975 RepID=A0AA89B5E0_9ASTE|nr:hypothetical protein RJ639_038853 [Escallonia herrerae]
MDSHTKVSSSGSHRKVDMKSEGDTKRTTARRFAVEDERVDINKQADSFIKKFRNQLKIQREESFKRFHEMIGRGT